jgi:hypothetical protein
VLARRAVLVGAGLSLVALRPARAAPFYYKEWRFDTSALANPPSAALTRSLEAQIDMVEALPFRPEILGFFRSFDVKVDPATLGKAALYRSQTRNQPKRGATVHRIYLSEKPVPPTQPVLLRMLMFAYLDRRVPDGFDSARIEDFYEAAKRGDAFQNRSPFMHHAAEFFADGAGAVLLGQWPVEPFSRAKVREKLPAFYAWIVREFVADGVALQ